MLEFVFNKGDKTKIGFEKDSFVFGCHSLLIFFLGCRGDKRNGLHKFFRLCFGTSNETKHR